MDQPDNRALARLIVSIGSMNDYGSSLLQTKQALDEKSDSPLNDNRDDKAIFNDAIAGIKAIKKIGFSTDGIIAINKEFKSDSIEEPDWPGHLRNAYYNEDDRITVQTRRTQDPERMYHPKDVISRNDIDNIVDTYNNSSKQEYDDWKIFASLSKLQPFQDGNKRTALIAANAAGNRFENSDFLVLPFNDFDREKFMADLMRYYDSNSDVEEDTALKLMIEDLPSPSLRRSELHKSIADETEEKDNAVDNLKTVNVKSIFHRNDD
ncbi:Fic family protein [Paucilactobacillus suebicus]|uniref:Fido domain-containing protein n=1 Tax=Paucilactobacillus suebicus DSM 5007 = KCTC 3549 TaxID=1423807 RepID=A0A0R1W2W1_9LACO|nr:Fic family protein [Paucilactobacillus suebicus]KRM12010.1 hypothetical protein FD16_GL000379 [Paucilactobacillus suebicus DSM 5007 = KCTC 3549]